MDENELTGRIVDAACQVHRAFGPGLLESICQAALGVELAARGIPYRTEVHLPVTYREKPLDLTFRVDMVVAGRVLVEVKALEKTAPIHTSQVLTYLRVTHLHLGLLLNFGCEAMKQGIRRIVNGDRPNAS